MNHRHLFNNLSVFCFVLFSLENVDSNYIIILLSNTSKGQVNISVHILSRRLYRKSYPEIQTSEHIIVRPRLYSSLPMLPPLGDILQIVVLGLSIISVQVVKEVRLSDFLLLRLRVSLDLVVAWCACLVARS